MSGFLSLVFVLKLPFHISSASYSHFCRPLHVQERSSETSALQNEGMASPELWECFSTIFGTSSIASIIGSLLEAFSFPSPRESSLSAELSLIQNLLGKTNLVLYSK